MHFLKHLSLKVIQLKQQQKSMYVELMLVIVVEKLLINITKWKNKQKLISLPGSSNNLIN